ncbi:MAG: DNA polymerase III subunit beta [Ignavibacteria bacterium]|jgi:predicted nucleotidyltransferase|nr:DNA polymerase III subunit beta [Ignavibacteria bacterium]MCU7522299.1 DNA polymerase III subunit beta [Ignavibacteria bacterium]MCU7526720.1 DNA polymerase III subunit beta [Ignavibacteria bacterium]
MKITKEMIDRIVSEAKNYGATRIIMFGSAVAAPETARDIDIALDGIRGWRIFEFAGKMEEELNIPLDVVSLSPSSRFTRHIENYGQILL